MQTRIITKWVVTVFLIGFVLLAYGAPVSRVTNFVDGQVLTASQLNGEFNNVIGGVNSINNAQIATNAQIAPSKIAATIKGDAIERDGTTGALSVKTDDTTVEISGDNVQIKDNGVTLAKMADNSVDTAELVDGAVTTAKIEDAAVTQAKRAALGQQISSSSGTGYSNATASFTDVTNLSVTITTTGRPVFIGMIGDGSSSVQLTSGGGGIITGNLRMLEGANTLFTSQLNQNIGASGDPAATLRFPCSAFSTVFVGTAATYTFKIQGAGGVNFNTTTLSVNNCKLVAYEL